MPGIVIVGAGFGGIGMGIALKKAGYHDFVILDKAIYLALEARAVGFTINPRLMAPLEAAGRMHLARQVTDPVPRARLTPDYTIGCKRILLPSDYCPALQRPNVDLITDHITRITEHGEVSEAAQRRYNDALQRRLRRAVWSEGGCDSWYLDAVTGS